MKRGDKYIRKLPVYVYWGEGCEIVMTSANTTPMVSFSPPAGSHIDKVWRAVIEMEIPQEYLDKIEDVGVFEANVVYESEGNDE